MKHKKLKIGYVSKSYPNVRNIINIDPDFQYVRVYDLNRLIQFTYEIINNKFIRRNYFDTKYFNFTFHDFNVNRVDLIHFFNSISYGKTPWLTTFETIIPRYSNTVNYHQGQENHINLKSYKNDKKVLKALRALSHDSCKKIICLSKCNLKIQNDFLLAFPEYRDSIVQKMIQIPPPQKVIATKNKSLKENETIHFMFVGRLFFTKGGLEIIEAFLFLKKNYNYNFKLSIISSLKLDDYATKKGINDVIKVKELINSNLNWIDFYEKLSNSEVLSLMKKAHIGLLPTHADTYGYSVLEFQSTGCPVITTNIRALPEINSDKEGWIIDVPKNKFGEALYGTELHRNELNKIIRNGIIDIVKDIMSNPEQIALKSKFSLERIVKIHSPKTYMKKIKKIYLESL